MFEKLKEGEKMRRINIIRSYHHAVYSDQVNKVALNNEVRTTCRAIYNTAVI